MFRSAISSSSGFCWVDFVNRFISSISFVKRFWDKTKPCVQLSPKRSTVHLGVDGWAGGSSGVLKEFGKNNDFGDFSVLEQLKSLIQKKGHIESWV